MSKEENDIFRHYLWSQAESLQQRTGNVLIYSSAGTCLALDVLSVLAISIAASEMLVFFLVEFIVL